MRTSATTPNADLDEAFVDGYDRFVRLASFIVGDDAEDAVMDAFLRVRSRQRHIDDPGPYLRMAVLNECRSRLRRRARTPRLALRPPPVRVPDCDGLWQVVIELPADQRAVVALRFYEDLTVPQIAAALRMAEGTVKSHLHRAMAALRPLVDRE